MFTSKLEVLVDFSPKPDKNELNKTLNDLRTHKGVRDAIFKDGAIMVETTLPNQTVLDIIAKTTGKRTVLQGFGDTQSAVAMVSSQGSGDGALGIIRFQQSMEALVVDGSIDNLPPGRHGLHVREDGDLSQGCSSVGDHYNPYNSRHGAPDDPPDSRHAGDLGNIEADHTGRATFRIVDNMLKISDIIGRCIAVTERPDDLGRGSSPNSSIDGDSGRPIACGVIARSAGVFQNPKRICQCDGVVVWDERDKPLAGKGRRDTCCGGKNRRTEQADGDVNPCCKF